MAKTCNLDRPSENMIMLRSIKLPNADPNILFVLDSLDLIIYVSDIDTFDILYINEHTRSLFGDIVGEKCYEALQHLKEPCIFCTNEKILQLKGNTYTWKYHNDVLNRTYIIKDRLIEWFDGRKVRLEIAWDITDVIIQDSCPLSGTEGGQICDRA